MGLWGENWTPVFSLHPIVVTKPENPEMQRRIWDSVFTEMTVVPAHSRGSWGTDAARDMAFLFLFQLLTLPETAQASYPPPPPPISLWGILMQLHTLNYTHTQAF